MSITHADQYTRFFVRRITKELIECIAPAKSYTTPKSSSEDPSNLWGAARELGIGILDLLKGILFLANPDRETYLKNHKSHAFPNVYGYFVVIVNKGEISVLTDPNSQVPKVGSEVFIVADLVGLPLARLTGDLAHTNLDPIYGQVTATKYAIDLWLDPGVSAWHSGEGNGVTRSPTLSHQYKERVGRFLQVFMDSRDSLTVEEFCQIASLEIRPLLNAQLTSALQPEGVKAQQAIVQFQESLTRMFGLSSEVIIRPGEQLFRHQLTIDDQSLPAIERSMRAAPQGGGNVNLWTCANCQTDNAKEHSFCKECGSSKKSVVHERGLFSRQLLSADGHGIIFDLSFVSYDSPNISLDDIALRCIEILKPYCRRIPLEGLLDPNSLINIARLLNVEFSHGECGRLGEFTVIDFRSVDTDWELNTRAKLRSQFRAIDAENAEIQVHEAALALREAQLAFRRKDRGVDLTEALDELEIAKSDAEIDLIRSTIELKKDLEERRLYSNNEIEIENLDRRVQRARRDLDKTDLKDAIQDERASQIDQLNHERTLENEVMDHDLQKEHRLKDAQILMNEKDLSFEERAARLRAARNFDIAREEQELDLHKRRGDLALELLKDKAGQDFELNKLEKMAEIELRQKEIFKGLTPAQILAMQASELSESGAHAALERLASVDAEHEKQMAAEKFQMYERMLELQARASEGAISSADASSKLASGLLNDFLEVQKDAAERVISAHEKSAENAAKWNEKSIESMAKVVTSAASKGNKQGEPVTNAKKVKCSECSSVNDSSNKFCGECGCNL